MSVGFEAGVVAAPACSACHGNPSCSFTRVKRSSPAANVIAAVLDDRHRRVFVERRNPKHLHAVDSSARATCDRNADGRRWRPHSARAKKNSQNRSMRARNVRRSAWRPDVRRVSRLDRRAVERQRERPARRARQERRVSARISSKVLPSGDSMTLLTAPAFATRRPNGAQLRHSSGDARSCTGGRSATSPADVIDGARNLQQRDRSRRTASRRSR